MNAETTPRWSAETERGGRLVPALFGPPRSGSTLLEHGGFGVHEAARRFLAEFDCLDDLCGEVTGGGVGIAGVVHGADLLLQGEHLPLFLSVLCQGADRANSAVDLDGDPLDRPAVAEHFVFEFIDFDRDKIAVRVEQPDLIVATGDGFVGAALNPEEWHRDRR